MRQDAALTAWPVKLPAAAPPLIAAVSPLHSMAVECQGLVAQEGSKNFDFKLVSNDKETTGRQMAQPRRPLLLKKLVNAQKDDFALTCL